MSYKFISLFPLSRKIYCHDVGNVGISGPYYYMNRPGLLCQYGEVSARALNENQKTASAT